MKNPLFNRQRGFSLVELILSIAALSVLAGFILQMFLTAAQVNVRAEEYDQATLLCEREIETALAYNAFDPLAIYLDKYWDETDAEVATYKLTFQSYRKGEGLETPRLLAEGSVTPSALTEMREFRCYMERLSDGYIICELVTRQVISLPDEEVYAP